MYKRIQLFWSLLLLGTFVLGHSHVKAETLPDTIAFVGQLEISESDVSHKMALEKVYGNITITENAALVSLVNSAIEREIARLNGIKAEPEEIADAIFFLVSEDADFITGETMIVAGGVWFG